MNKINKKLAYVRQAIYSTIDLDEELIKTRFVYSSFLKAVEMIVSCYDNDKFDAKILNDFKYKTVRAIWASTEEQTAQILAEDVVLSMFTEEKPNVAVYHLFYNTVERLNEMHKAKKSGLSYAEFKEKHNTHKRLEEELTKYSKESIRYF